jgi:hypothetical protein
MVLGGPATGFIYKDSIYDMKTDLRGYIGILDKTQSIYVVLRGSSSLMNWIDDAEVRKVPYTTYANECNKCEVHHGFYRSALGVKSQTVESVKILQKEYPRYEVVVTGHSYGASVGQLLAMELAKEGISVEVIDLRTIRPLDIDSIVNSVKKTNRLIILEESWPVASISTEITYRVQRHAFDYLDAPIRRITQTDTPFAFATSLIDAALPGVHDVVRVAKEVCYKA